MSVKPIIATGGSSMEFELVPAGVYLARCFKMIDIGTQTIVSPTYGTQDLRQVMLTWELLQDDDGEKVLMAGSDKPFAITKKYTLSMNKKANLRKDLDSWRGVPFTDAEADSFDITKLLGAFCKLQVVHNVSGGKTYANVGSIMTTKKKEEGINEIVGFSMSDPDMEVFNTLPEWIQNKIKESAEWHDEDDSDVADSNDGVKEVPLSDIPF